MSPRRVLLLATLLCCATRPASASVPVECASFVDPPSRSGAASAEATRRCVDALRAEEAAAVAGGPAHGDGEAARPVRKFAVLRELGELRIRSDAARASLLGAQAAAEADPERCALASRGAASVPTAECLRCHPRLGPVDVFYATSHARASWSLRAEDEVVRRGVLLPDGRIECVTCHDGASPWKYKIALPPGAPAIPAVIPGQPETYGNGSTWRTASASRLPRLPPGTQVSTAPLCAACHTHAD